jgi:iron complex transport system substrate-binding protein
MRVVSHTASNTEIVCALGAAHLLVGVDADSDHPADVIGPLPKLGRDLDLDIAQVLALRPDLVLSSLTVPGHERVVAALSATGLPTLVLNPLSLEDVYASIRDIAAALGLADRGERLVAEMCAAMPPVAVSGPRRRVLVEWWPKPVIAPAQQSWINGLLQLAGGVNPWEHATGPSITLETADVLECQPELVIMSWCGVQEHHYRPELVRRRAGWAEVDAVRSGRIHAVSEAYLGRPGPRLVEGYRRLRDLISACG